VQKTERDIERATAEARLNTQQTLLTRDVDIARIEAKRTLESKDEEIKKIVELKRAAAELERLRATDVVKASITREAKQQAADAKAYEVVAEAKADFEKSQQHSNAVAYKATTEANAMAQADFNRTTKHTDATAYTTRIDAEARNYATVQTAEANLVAKLKEAEGISAMADAYAKMAQAFGGPAGLLQYMMIEKGTYVALAKANADAVRGMQPKISVWNTGSQEGGAGGAGSATDTMRNVYQMLPPLMTTINEQTGITLPEWQFGKLAATTNEVSNAQNHKQTNGPR
jgi:flotillin